MTTQPQEQKRTRPPPAPATPEVIAVCAYIVWEKEGRPHGRDCEHWLQAEAQLIAERIQAAGELAVAVIQVTSPLQPSLGEPIKAAHRRPRIVAPPKKAREHEVPTPAGA